MIDTVESVMALAQKCMPEEISQTPYDALRAAVEKMVRERDDFYMDYRMKCDEKTKELHVKLERAEAERDAWEATANHHYKEAFDAQEKIKQMALSTRC